MKLGIEVRVKGFIDVPDEWDDPKNPQRILDVADYRYTEQLTAKNVVLELMTKMSKHADDIEAEFQFSREVKE